MSPPRSQVSAAGPGSLSHGRAPSATSACVPCQQQRPQCPGPLSSLVPGAAPSLRALSARGLQVLGALITSLFAGEETGTPKFKFKAWGLTSQGRAWFRGRGLGWAGPVDPARPPWVSGEDKAYFPGNAHSRVLNPFFEMVMFVCPGLRVKFGQKGQQGGGGPDHRGESPCRLLPRAPQELLLDPKEGALPAR